ncbi:MAG: type VI secretion system tip protein TssI/VgrG [Aliishimia sp.]
MNAIFKQDSRLGKLHTKLGKDKLVLLRFDGTDHVNALFEYHIEALSTDDSINFDQLVGTHATVELTAEGQKNNFFDGIVTQARWIGPGENGIRYDLTVRPWFWLAGHRRNQRIFHDMSVVQILEELLGTYSGLGEPALENRLARSYPELEYTVQYRESDLSFALRQMERFGISYHFVHKQFSHTLVLTDATDQHDVIEGATRPYYGYDGHHQSDGEHFWGWSPERNLTVGAMRQTDYNFKRPNTVLETDHMGDAAYDQGQIESYDYPGDYLDDGVGNVITRLRMDQERGQDRRHYAKGDCTSLHAGLRVTRTGDELPQPDKKDHKSTEFLCLEAKHSYVSDSYGSGGQDSDGYAYSATYVLIPIDAPLAPRRKTHIPVVQGPQTAVVVGDGEIDCDQFGRILVRFHWDLTGSISMRCRVSQNWASKGWGGMVIPRIGMEVVVEFLEGDPDKPLVTGCVFNGANQPPYALPAHKTKSVFKTDTHQGAGFNELTFEDEKDQELIYMHGQKDQLIEILNDRTKSIGRDEFNTIGRDRVQTVGQDETMSVGRDQRETIGQDVTYQVGRDQQEKYGKDHVHVVGNIHKQDIYADHIVNVGTDFTKAVKGKYTLNVNDSITNNTKTHTLMAFNKMVMKGPGGKITIDSGGITLEAAKINLKGAVSMGGGGGAQVPTLQGAANDRLPLVEECIKQKGEE